MTDLEQYLGVGQIWLCLTTQSCKKLIEIKTHSFINGLARSYDPKSNLENKVSILGVFVKIMFSNIGKVVLVCWVFIDTIFPMEALWRLECSW